MTPQKANCEWSVLCVCVGRGVCEGGGEEVGSGEWSDKFKQGNNFFSGRQYT